MITKETWRELVLEAESLVRQKINDQTTKTEYFFNEIVHAKNNQRKQQQQQQTQKKLMEKSHKDTAKISRVQVRACQSQNVVKNCSSCKKSINHVKKNYVVKQSHFISLSPRLGMVETKSRL